MTTNISATTEVVAKLLTNNALVQEYNSAVATMESYKRVAGHLEQQIHTRLAAIDANALTDDDGVILVKRTPRTPDYDQGYLVALKEILSDDSYKECWVEAWAKETIVAAHWDMQQVKKYARMLGKSVQDILDRARLPGKPGKLEFAEVPAADAGAG